MKQIINISQGTSSLIKWVVSLHVSIYFRVAITTYQTWYLRQITQQTNEGLAYEWEQKS